LGLSLSFTTYCILTFYEFLITLSRSLLTPRGQEDEMKKKMTHLPKPTDAAIKNACKIREEAREAAEDRDFAISEAHRNYANIMRWLHEDEHHGKCVKIWFAATRRKIYQRLKREYPNLTAGDWKTLHEIMGTYLCVEQLMCRAVRPQLSLLDINSRSLVFVSHTIDRFGDVSHECARMIIRAFKMARTMCAGMLTITVYHKSHSSCIINFS